MIATLTPPTNNGLAGDYNQAASDFLFEKRAAAPQLQTLDDVRTLFRSLGENCRAQVQGRENVIALVLTAMFADGHVLLEDHPGSGKTTLARALGDSIASDASDEDAHSFRRIQFTPDLLPSDVTGGTMFDASSNKFIFRAGPLFANVVLADEINRTSPKVQAALLEAMAEKQVTVDNQTHRLGDLFFVLATQNPLDLAGTYPLPRAQLDRFLFKIKMAHLSRAHQLEVLSRRKKKPTGPVARPVSPETIVAARRIVTEQVEVHTMVHECLVDLSEALRHDRRVLLGISTRSLVQALPALQVWAMLNGRTYVTPKDVAMLAVPLFAHRLELAGGAEAETVVNDCVKPIVEALAHKTMSR